MEDATTKPAKRGAKSPIDKERAALEAVKREHGRKHPDLAGYYYEEVRNGKVRFCWRISIGGRGSAERYVRKDATAKGLSLKVAKFIADLVNNGMKPADRQKTTVAERADLWLSQKRRGNRADSTIRSYGQMVEYYVKPCLGALQVDNLTSTHVMRLVEFVKGKKGPKGEPLSDRTARYAVDVLFRMVGSKVKARIMEDESLELPSANSVRSRRLSPDELAEVLTELYRKVSVSEKRAGGELVREERSFYAYRNRFLIAFLMNTGVRINEALGITVDRIDLTPGRERVTIDRQLKWQFDKDGHRTGWTLSALKTDKSKRVLPLNPDAVEAIRGMTETIAGDALLMEEGYSKNGLLFASEHGTPIDGRGAFRTLQLVTKAVNKRRRMIDPQAQELAAFGLHDLRRSYLTCLAMNEPRMAVVSYLAGHANPATTAKHYIWANEDNAAEAAAKVGFRARESVAL